MISDMLKLVDVPFTIDTVKGNILEKSLSR